MSVLTRPAVARPGVARAAAGGLAVALVAYVVAAVSAGSAPAAPPAGLPDPGVLVRWGVPTLAVARDVALSVLLGGVALVLALGAGTPRWVRRTVASAAAGASGVAVAGLWFSTADVYAVSLSDALRPALVADLVDSTSLGTRLVEQAAGWAAVAVLAGFLLRRPGRSAAGLLALVSTPVMLSVALTGHGVLSGSHLWMVAIGWVHLVGAAVWVGGVLLITGAARFSGDFWVCYRGYAPVALVASLLVGVSGVANTMVRVGGLPTLHSSYTALAAAKLVLLLVVVGVAATHRAAVTGSASTEERAPGGTVARIVAVEAVGMLVLMGLAVALSRTPFSG